MINSFINSNIFSSDLLYIRISLKLTNELKLCKQKNVTYIRHQISLTIEKKIVQDYRLKGKEAIVRERDKFQIVQKKK